MQAVINQHVNKIFTRLGERGYEFPDEEDKKFLEQVFSQTLTEFSQLTNAKGSGMDQQSQIRATLQELLQLNGTAPQQPAPTGKRISGYNLFTKRYIAEHGGNVTQVGGIWKQLTQAEKDEYNQEAAQINQQNGIVPGAKTGGTKKLSGYNLFTKEQMPLLKNMKEVGAAWKSLSPEEQQVWRDKATAL